MTEQFLSFMLDGEMYAMNLQPVREIIEYPGETTVPMMPPCIRGVINLRGAVVPVLDLSVRFGRGASQIGRRSCIVIVETAGLVIGVLVDAVNTVLEIDPAEVEPPPSFGARLRIDFIAGVGKWNGRLVILLNTETVLSPEEIAAVDSLAEQGGLS
ncbi:chemotaxis protein CheW [Pseudoduganella sp. RAF53_2]|uniref:chemotaxis protein CheW n=1 Tax=unclassified Pseudoduganella TaxID=2637179 RepID=UPI003F94BA23